MISTAEKKVTAIILVCVLLISVFIIWTVWGNKALELNKYTLQSDRLPQEFDGFRIAHLSDFHNTEIGEENEKLLSVIKEAEPDIIAITGDMIDSRRTNVEIALDFAREIIKIAPCYYVTGNHEARLAESYNLKEALSELGVIVLEDDKTEIEIGNAKIRLIGVDDPRFSDENYADAVMTGKLDILTEKDDTYTLLLSHRPELFSVYCEYKVDLVLSGHAHGGQFRIPFLGGVIAPDQGLFPEFDSGLYTKGRTNMIVSRGIGNSIIPLRFNNRPEVIAVELKAEG